MYALENNECEHVCSTCAHWLSDYFKPILAKHPGEGTQPGGREQREAERTHELSEVTPRTNEAH